MDKYSGELRPRATDRTRDAPAGPLKARARAPGKPDASGEEAYFADYVIDTSGRRKTHCVKRQRYMRIEETGMRPRALVLTLCLSAVLAGDESRQLERPRVATAHRVPRATVVRSGDRARVRFSPDEQTTSIFTRTTGWPRSTSPACLSAEFLFQSSPEGHRFGIIINEDGES